MSERDGGGIKRGTMVHSFNCAIEGLLHVLRSQRNMRLHFLFAMMVLVLSLLLGIRGVELLLVTVIIGLVLLTEMFNTAVEQIVDLIARENHPAAGVVKDISAGAVLVAAFCAAIVGTAIFPPHLMRIFTGAGVPVGAEAVAVIGGEPRYLIFVSLTVICVVVVVAKAVTGRGTPLRGGVLSGHSAVAFSIWAIVFFLLSGRYKMQINFLVFALALVIAVSRIRRGVHRPREVLAGAVVGILITFLVFVVIGGKAALGI